MELGERISPDKSVMMMMMMNANLFSFTDRCSRFCAAARAQLPDRGSIPLSTSGFRWKQVGERERHSAKKFLSDDLHVEANDRKSRFMSFTLMLTLWPLTYHFFPHRWKLRRAAYNRTHHGVATMHADAIRLIVRTRPKIVLSLASPEKESCPGQSSFSTSPIKFESLSI